MRKLIIVNVICKERIPEGIDCGNCKYCKKDREYDSFYCHLFSAWLHPYVKVMGKEPSYSAYKCDKCLETINKTIADPSYCADTR